VPPTKMNRIVTMPSGARPRSAFGNLRRLTLVPANEEHKDVASEDEGARHDR
jgi:hypothetical protein